MKLAECGYETSKPGYESSGYERSMGTKRLDTRFKHESMSSKCEVDHGMSLHTRQYTSAKFVLFFPSQCLCIPKCLYRTWHAVQ